MNDKYERLTPKDLVKTINMPQYGDNTRFLLYAQRLWDLENQIERGELVNTADHYIRSKKMPNHKNKFLVCRHGILEEVYGMFDTIEEAEQRLKELKGE